MKKNKTHHGQNGAKWKPPIHRAEESQGPQRKREGVLGEKSKSWIF